MSHPDSIHRPGSRAEAVALDAADPLARLREQFDLPPGQIYLDGNSLGALPRATPDRVAAVLRQQWGQDLIQSWNKADWITLPQRIGDRIARLIGAQPGEVVAADSTSVNLYKVLAQAMRIQDRQRPTQRVIVSERSNFPTDLYIAEGLCRERGWTLNLIDDGTVTAASTQDAITARLAAGDVGILMLTQVNYRTGALHDLDALTAQAHAAGALAVWDLAHSAGALPVDLNGADGGAGADFAVGCGYKYLNGGPGAPAFLWSHPRHATGATGATDKHAADWQPLCGWMGHAAPFAFTPGYQPAAGASRWLCGTPAVLAMAALDCGVDTLLAAEPLGGLAALRAKSLALTAAFAVQAEARCGGFGIRVVSPRDGARRGSQVSLTFTPPDSVEATDLSAGHASTASPASSGYAVVQALIKVGVTGDFRAGELRPDGSRSADILRFGFTPLYTRHVDAWDAVEQLHAILADGRWRESRFHRRSAVT
ncbi:MAG: kynureninase [Leptothrix sp. (in: b-proteobacteria)]